MATKKTAFLRPDIDFSDDDEVSEGARLISNKIKKTRTNVNAIKNPNKYEDEVKVAQEEDDDDDEPEVLSDDDSSVRRPNPRASKKRKSDIGPGDKKKSKKSKRSDSDDEFLPEDRERSDNDEDEEDEEDVASEDLSDDFDSDFNPDDEEEADACQEDYEVPADGGEQGGDGATINLSSDGEASPEKKEQRKTFDTNGKEFWDKVQELRSKGFSIQQAGNGATKSNPPAVPAKNVPKSPIRPKGGQAMSRLTAFSNLVINFDHDKRCVRKCFLMEPKQKQTLAEITSPGLLSPEFVKGCIKIVNCNFRLGDVENTKEAVNMISDLASIPGVSALCHALIGGVKAQMSNIGQFTEHEKAGMAALKTKEFTKALESLDRALSLSSACLRLKMARGDCLAHLGRYVEGAKAASSILQQDQRNVGALFLRGFCLYHKNNIDRALSHFQQVLAINKEHERAKTLLNKAKMFKDKRDAAQRALNEKRLNDAEKYFTDALGIDPRNKGTNANLLAERAEVYFSLKKFDLSVADCEASLKLDQHCMAAMLGRAKCHIEAEEWEAAVRIMERMNTRDRHNQQGKLKAGEAAQKAGNQPEAVRLFSEAVDVDKHNQKYRHLLREAKQKLLLETRVDFYGVLGIEKTVGDSEIRKAYFKKSKEYHPDRHANDSDEVKEEFSKKFKFAKEAYEILSDIDKRKMYDSGRVKAPPGGWYQDVDKKIYETVQMRGGLRGRGVMRGMVRGGLMVRGGPVLRPQMARGQVRPVMTRGGPQVRARPIMRVAVRPGARPVVRGPINVRPGLRPIMRPGVRPTLMRPGMARPRGGLVRGAPNGVRSPINGTRPRLNGISITPISQPDVVDVDHS